MGPAAIPAELLLRATVATGRHISGFHGNGGPSPPPSFRIWLCTGPGPPPPRPSSNRRPGRAWKLNKTTRTCGGLLSATGWRGGQRESRTTKPAPQDAARTFPPQPRPPAPQAHYQSGPRTLHRMRKGSLGFFRTPPAVRARGGPGRAGDPGAGRVGEGPGSRGIGEPGKVRKGRGGLAESPGASRRVRHTDPAAPPPHPKSRPARAPPEPVDRRPERTPTASASAHSSRPCDRGTHGKTLTAEKPKNSSNRPRRGPAQCPTSARAPPFPAPCADGVITPTRSLLPCQRCPRPGATWPPSPPPLAGFRVRRRRPIRVFRLCAGAVPLPRRLAI